MLGLINIIWFAACVVVVMPQLSFHFPILQLLKLVLNILCCHVNIDAPEIHHNNDKQGISINKQIRHFLQHPRLQFYSHKAPSNNKRNVIQARACGGQFVDMLRTFFTVLNKTMDMFGQCVDKFTKKSWPLFKAHDAGCGHVL